MLGTIVLVVYLFLLSAIVVIQNPKKLVNISLGVSIAVIGLWFLATYGLRFSFGSELWYGRSVFSLGLIATYSLFWFVYELLNSMRVKGNISQRLFFSTSLTTCFVGVLTATTPFVIKGVVRGTQELPTPEYGGSMLLYAGVVVLLITTTTTALFRGYLNAKNIVRSRLASVGLSVVIALCIGLITNLVAPLLSGNVNSALYMPFAIVVLATGLSYSLSRQRLLDFRGYMLRALAYFVTTLFLSILYIAPVVYLVFVLLGAQLNLEIFVAIVAIVTLAATIYGTLHKLFDKITGHVFFRDTYDPASLLSELNEELVSSVDTNELLNKTRKLLLTSFSPESCELVILRRGGQELYYCGHQKRKAWEVLGQLAGQFEGAKKSTTILNLGASEYGIESSGISGQMRVSEEGKRTTIGYISLGVRVSGGIYDKQDMHVIDSVINTLAIAVQNSLRFEEINSFNETLEGRVQAATADIQATNRKLKALDQAKDEFISLTSHQLRTPLTTVKGYISMLLDGDGGTLRPSQRKLLEEAFHSSQRMVHLISDFLNISRIQTGKFEIEPSETNLAEILDEEIEQLRVSAVSRQVELAYDKPRDFPVMSVDEGKIRQVMMNFIDNAIYYSPRGGQISVVLSHTASTVEFKVIDQGIGVPAKEQHLLFAKFSRASNAKKQRPDGTGIGLFMAKKVIVAHEGSIIFESKEGRGSTFGFRLNRK